MWMTTIGFWGPHDFHYFCHLLITPCLFVCLCGCRKPQHHVTWVDLFKTPVLCWCNWVCVNVVVWSALNGGSCCSDTVSLLCRQVYFSLCVHEASDLGVWNWRIFTACSSGDAKLWPGLHSSLSAHNEHIKHHGRASPLFISWHFKGNPCKI